MRVVELGRPHQSPWQVTTRTPKSATCCIAVRSIESIRSCSDAPAADKHQGDFTRLDFGDQGLEPAEAVAQVRRSRPIFGDPRHPSEYQSEDDRPLPRELKSRVSTAAAMLATRVTDRHTSMNAVVREAIRAGRI